MHVIATAIRLLKHLFARKVGEDAQLDLGIVSTEQGPAVLRQEGLADSPAVLGAYRDVLQVGVAAAQPTCRRHRLVEIGVDPSCFRFHQLGQGIDVGAFEFAQHPVLQHERDYGMVIAEFLQHGGVGAESCFGAAGFLAIQPQGVEQQFPQLFGRGQVEVHPGSLLGLVFQPLQGAAHFC